MSKELKLHNFSVYNIHRLTGLYLFHSLLKTLMINLKNDKISVFLYIHVHILVKNIHNLYLSFIFLQDCIVVVDFACSQLIIIPGLLYNFILFLLASRFSFCFVLTALIRVLDFDLSNLILSTDFWTNLSCVCRMILIVT